MYHSWLSKASNMQYAGEQHDLDPDPVRAASRQEEHLFLSNVVAPRSGADWRLEIITSSITTHDLRVVTCNEGEATPKLARLLWNVPVAKGNFTSCQRVSAHLNGNIQIIAVGKSAFFRELEQGRG